MQTHTQNKRNNEAASFALEHLCKFTKNMSIVGNLTLMTAPELREAIWWEGDNDI